MSGRTTLVGLEDRFVQDRDGVERDKVVAELDGYLAAARKAMDRGLPPEEFRNLAKYRSALECARESVGKVWRMLVER